jgi:hypothetical protein
VITAAARASKSARRIDLTYTARPGAVPSVAYAVVVSTPTRRYHVPSALRRSSLRIEPDDARKLIADGALLVDVRRQDEVELRLDGAVRIPPDEMPGRLGELPRDHPIILVCT